MIGYDGISIHEDILLDLPLSEGAGTVVRDQAISHHEHVNQNDPGGGEFVWARGLTEGQNAYGRGFDWGFDARIGIGCLEFSTSGGGFTDGVYLDLAAVDCVDLNFIADNFSIGIWINWVDTTWSEIVIGRYTVNASGWELYLTRVGIIDYLTLRHHHAGTLVGGNPRSACYSVGWTPGVWCLMGVSRIGGGEGLHYRNGVAVEMTTQGLVDPETSNNDLVIGCRYTKDSYWYSGQMWRPRIWNRVLSELEWLDIFEKERDFFGV